MPSVAVWAFALCCPYTSHWGLDFNSSEDWIFKRTTTGTILMAHSLLYQRKNRWMGTKTARQDAFRRSRGTRTEMNGEGAGCQAKEHGPCLVLDLVQGRDPPPPPQAVKCVDLRSLGLQVWFLGRAPRRIKHWEGLVWSPAFGSQDHFPHFTDNTAEVQQS